MSGDTLRSVAEVILEPEGTIVHHGLHTGVIFAHGRVAIADGFLEQVGSAVGNLDRPDNATLVIHNNVDVPDENQFRQITPLFKKVFSSNVPDGIPGVTPVPLGLENAFRHKNGRLNYYLDALECPTPLIERTETVVSNFHTSTNPRVREATRETLRHSRHGHHEQFVKSLEYRQLIRRTKFVISPPGNGNDCHRTWEALYLGAVPVVLRDFLATSLTADLPILAVDSYEDFCNLTDEELDERWSELERREQRLRLASKRLRSKSSKMKSREQQYKDRVKRLKEREAKIKRLIERRREAKQRGEDPSEPRKMPPR